MYRLVVAAAGCGRILPVNGDDPTSRSVGGLFPAPGGFSFPIGADPMGTSGSVLRPAASRRYPPIAIIRACALFAGDLSAILMAVTVAVFLHAAVQSPPMLRAVEQVDRYGLHWSGWSTLFVLVLMAGYFEMTGHYTGRLPLWLELKGLVVGTLVALMLDLVIRATVFGAPCGFETIVRWLLMPPAVLLTRQAVQVILQQYGLWALRTLVIDERAGQADARAALNAELGMDYSVVMTVGLAEAADSEGRDLEAMVKNAACEFVVLVVGAGTADASKRERIVMSSLDRTSLRYALAPALGGYSVPITGYNSRHDLKPGAVMLVRDHRVVRLLRRMAKSVLDRTAALLLILVFSPVFLFLFWRIRADGGPALFGHKRIGANGVQFRCLKFRTMVPNSDEVLRNLLLHDPEARTEWSTKRKLTNDPRITRLGRFLRTSSLDELPQLVNVIKGEMSLVGPRPIVQDEVQFYGHDFMYYCDTKPGITGLWQVSGRSGTTYEERVRCDVWYVQNWTFWHDCAILIKTISTVLQRKGAI
jgi:Undecaprenyl-phosphate galactose phosphotransferase WbaP